MRKIYCVSSRSPLLDAPKGVNVIFPSIATDDGVWLTLVTVPIDKKWDNFTILQTFAYEGAYSSQFLQFGRV